LLPEGPERLRGSVLKKSLNILLLLSLLVVGCGKNLAVGAYGQPYSGYAIDPTTGLPIDPSTGMPFVPSPIGGVGSPTVYPGVPTFVPQLPPGYPMAYTPFLPIDFFMRNNPQFVGYWSSFWMQWVGFSAQYGYSQYDFVNFWLTFCPTRWNTPGFINLYAYLNQNFYGWVRPGAILAPSMVPSVFWQNYAGFSYGPVWNYSYSFGYAH
jgi:hypothetical protein